MKHLAVSLSEIDEISSSEYSEFKKHTHPMTFELCPVIRIQGFVNFIPVAKDIS